MEPRQSSRTTTQRDRRQTCSTRSSARANDPSTTKFLIRRAAKNARQQKVSGKFTFGYLKVRLRCAARTLILLDSPTYRTMLELHFVNLPPHHRDQRLDSLMNHGQLQIVRREKEFPFHAYLLCAQPHPRLGEPALQHSRIFAHALFAVTRKL